MSGSTPSAKADKNPILHIKEIKNLASSKVGNEVTQKLITIGCHMSFEVGPEGAINILVRRTSDNSLFCTFSDFERTFTIGSLLKEILEETGKGGPAEEVINRIARLAVHRKWEDDAVMLPGNKSQASILANYIKNLGEIEETFLPMKRSCRENPLVKDFSNLINSSFGILAEAHVRLGGPKEVSLIKDVFPDLAEKAGVPLWFLDLIKSPRDLKQHIQTNKPYRLFFHSKGKGSIVLRTKEWENHFVWFCIPNVMQNSLVVRQFVAGIVSRNGNFKTILPMDPNAQDEALLENMSWPVVPAHIDVADFLDQKIRKKVCDLVPYGSATYKSGIERIKSALIRVLFLETSRIEDNETFWSTIIGSDVKQVIGQPIWDTVQKKPDFDSKVNDFWKFEGANLRVFVEVLGHSLSSFSNGPIQTAIGDIFANDIVIATDFEEKILDNSGKDDTDTDKDKTLPSKIVYEDDVKLDYEIPMKFGTVCNGTLRDMAAVYRDPNHKMFSHDKNKDVWWDKNGSSTIVPELGTEEVKKAKDLFNMMIGSKIEIEDQRITRSYQMCSSVKEMWKQNNRILSTIDPVAKKKFFAHVVSFSQEALQMDVASTVFGTIEKFRVGAFSDDERIEDEETDD